MVSSRVIRQQIKRMLKKLEATGIRRILQIELAAKPDSGQRGMTASGMIVINPPWKLEQQMHNGATVATQCVGSLRERPLFSKLGGAGIMASRRDLLCLLYLSMQSLRQTHIKR